MHLFHKYPSSSIVILPLATNHNQRLCLQAFLAESMFIMATILHYGKSGLSTKVGIPSSVSGSRELVS